MRRTLAENLITATSLMVLILAGCAAPQGTPPAVVEVQPPGEPEGSAIAEADVAGLSPVLFGESPSLEPVPFENRLITNLRQHTFTCEGLDFDPDIAPDGETLVFASTRNAERADLYLKNVEGTALTQLTGDPAEDIQPRFSPDGQMIVFCSNRTGNWDIWLIGRDGTGLTQLTNDRSDEIAPCWSPDGLAIAYTVQGYRSHQWEIWTLDANKPGVRRFLAYGMFPVWSPDGSQVAFQRARQRGSRWFSVWTVDLKDGEARHPTEVAHSDERACIAPCWSPDGSTLVYCAIRPGRTTDIGGVGASSAADLWSVDLETGLRMKLTDGAAGSFNPVWGPNGRVFFVSARAGTENVWSLTATERAYARADSLGPRVSRGPSNEKKQTAEE